MISAYGKYSWLECWILDYPALAVEVIPGFLNELNSQKVSSMKLNFNLIKGLEMAR